MKPRVLLIHPRFFVYGGAERQIVYLCNYLTDNNYRVTIITQETVPELRENLKETRLIVIKDPNALVGTVRNLLPKFDIVNPHNHPAEFFTPPVKIPSVWQCNEPPSHILAGQPVNEIEKRLVQKYITKVMVISEFDQIRFKKLYGMDSIVNYPGVKYEYFNKKGTGKDKYKLKDSFVLIEPGYLTWTKNQLKAVELFSEVKEEIKNSKLLLAGYDKDPYSNQVKKLIKKLNLRGDVIITGYIEKDSDVRDLYYLSDILIGPFLKQGGWASTFEALVCGVPIVVSDAFPGAEVIRRHNLGVAISIDNFKKEIFRIYDNLDEEKSKAKKASKWIGNNLTWDKFGERYSKVFDELYWDA